jgi:uncharacterized protein (TIGR01777 family)
VKVVMTGATGFIGVKLAGALRARGDHVVALTRDAARAAAKLPDIELVTADLEQPGAWCAALDGADAIVNLAGEPIAGVRWDARQKQKLRDSRVETTRTLVEAIAKATPRPRVLVSASGADYYPYAIGLDDFDDDEVTEADPPGEAFLARLCKSWETEALAAQQLGLRVCVMRTGLVLGEHGGALAKMTTPFKLFVGGKIGHGRQWMSWIHLDDVVAAYATALSDDRYTGPINLVAASIRNADFAKALGKTLHRPSWIPVPAFALRAAVGEIAESLLNGRRVVPKRLRELGFTYLRPRLDEALAHTR